MSSTLRNQIITAVSGMPMPQPTATNAAWVSQQQHNRVYMTIFLAMASPEYLAQR